MERNKDNYNYSCQISCLEPHCLLFEPSSWGKGSKGIFFNGVFIVIYTIMVSVIAVTS